MFHPNPNDPVPETEKRSETTVEIAPNCPRCASPSTKFCYYNNYSVSQPRYFCKSCRRYWTKGGSLRNVPVGGGCRRNRRSKSSAKPRSSRPESSSLDELAESSNNGDHSGIDLAVVFANFLNQNPNPNRVDPDPAREPVSESPGANAFTPLSGISSNTYSAQFNEADLMQEVTELEAIGVGGSDFGQEVFWSDFSWQPVAQLQEIEAFQSSLNNNNNNNNNNIWSSFDFSGFEVFSAS